MNRQAGKNKIDSLFFASELCENYQPPFLSWYQSFKNLEMDNQATNEPTPEAVINNTPPAQTQGPLPTQTQTESSSSHTNMHVPISFSFTAPVKLEFKWFGTWLTSTGVKRANSTIE